MDSARLPCPQIILARILEWVAMSSSRGSSWPRDWTCISYVSCVGRWILYWATWEAQVRILDQVAIFSSRGSSWSRDQTCLLWPPAFAGQFFTTESPGKHILRQIAICCSVAKWWPTLCDAMDCSRPGFPVLYYLLELAQTHVHWISDAIQPSHPLSLPSPPAFSLCQHQGLFQWVSSLHQVAKILKLQHQSFQWILRVDFL